MDDLAARGPGSDGFYARPPAFDVDYGVPEGECRETAAGSGVFERAWSKARVAMDCARFAATITMKPPV